jgi:hypothetical protein
MRNTQRKGDTAVAQAIATFTKMGYDVLIPLTESACYDLVVDVGNKLKRIQVKYCGGNQVGLRRIHSNSKGYVIKRIKKNTFDWLYVLNNNNEEFLIVKDLSNRNCINPQSTDRIEKVIRLIK